MPFTFYSKASASIIMLDADAKKLLSIIGKDPAPTGIITLSQIPAAIEALTAASRAEEQAAPKNHNTQQEYAEDHEEKDDDDIEPVSLRLRTFPLLEMLQKSLDKSCDVVWER